MYITDDWTDFLLKDGFFEPHRVWELGIVIVLLFLTSRFLRCNAEIVAIKKSNPIFWIRRNQSFLAFLVLVGLAFLICTKLQIEAPILRFFGILGIAWSAIGLLTSLVRNLFWARSAAVTAYAITGFLGLSKIDNSIKTLESFKVTIGDSSITAWNVIYGLFAFAVSFWLVMAITGIIENQIQKIPRISPSLKVLTTKILRISFISIAVIVAVSSVGIDMSAITVLSGAVGVGVGFGLQKVVSNFISGILLLVDNSIKPGDVIEVSGTYGRINNLRARYASVITRDGTEHLIPNEDLITQNVVNWTFTHNKVRMRVPFGVSYNSDPHECMRLVIEAVESVDRVLDDPKPICNLMEFGDNSINFEVRFWITDPMNGVANVKSLVQLKIWDTFKEHNIEIPFPQRDLHIRSSSVDFSKLASLKQGES